MDKNITDTLKNFSISNSEEVITQQLNNTHIKQTNPFLTTTDPSSQPTETPIPVNNNNNDGWGEGPPGYGSVLKGTYFGFNSVMESPLNNSNDTTTHTSKAFSRYKNKPVTFTSHLEQDKQ